MKLFKQLLLGLLYGYVFLLPCAVVATILGS
jgi:hypothetical protein